MNQRNDQCKRARFQTSEHVLDDASRAEAADVDEREHRDRYERDKRLARDDERNQRQRDGEDWRRIRRRWNEARDVVGKRKGAGGDRARETGDERGPPRQECRERTKRFAEVDVLAACPRPKRGQFRIRHRPGERQCATDEPYPEDGSARPHHLRDDDRHKKNSAADDVGDDDGRGVDRTESSIEQRRCRCNSGSVDIARHVRATVSASAV